MTARNRRRRKRQDNRKLRGTDLAPVVKKPAAAAAKPKRKVRYQAKKQTGVPTPENWLRRMEFNGGYTDIFVYGTLREGHGLASRLDGPRESAKAKGRLYFVSGHGGYPVCDFREDGDVIGEIIRVPNKRDGSMSKRLLDTLGMEEGAGYTIRSIEVMQVHWGREYPRQVLACCWENERRGDRIESGDFSRTVWADEVYERAFDSEDEWLHGRAPRKSPIKKRPAAKTRRPVVVHDEPGFCDGLDDQDEWRASDGSCLLCDSFTGHDIGCPAIRKEEGQ